MRRSTFRTLVLPTVVVAGLAAALAGPGLASRNQASITTVNVTASEFKFKLVPGVVRHGIVIFKVTNKGKLAHDFKIAGRKTPLIKPGKSNTLRMTIRKGKQAYICTVPGHAAAGMKGTLTVT